MSDAATGKAMVAELLSGQGKLDRKRSRRLARLNSSTDGVEELKLLSLEQVAARKPGIVPKMWTSEEDEKLRQAIKVHGDKNWREVAKLISDRSYIQCLQRWKKALRPGLVKGHWTKEEDSNLLKLVEFYAPNWDWNFISKKIPGRNAKQCRERWFLNLDPDINRGPWSQEEDSILLKYVSQWGSRWALIAKQLPGRTENSVKTRFHSLKRKEARNRPWSAEEDDAIISGVLRFGREFDLVQNHMNNPSRTKGQIKKRFTIIQQQRPELMRQVYAVEDSIRVNGIPDQENSKPEVPDGPMNSTRMRRKESAPLDQIQNTLLKTDSTLLLSNLLEENYKMDTTAWEKSMVARQDSLNIPFPLGTVTNEGVKSEGVPRPKFMRRYNTSVEMLSHILNEPKPEPSNNLENNFFLNDGVHEFTEDPNILKRADSLFNKAFGNKGEGLKKVDSFLEEPSLKKVDSFLSTLSINEDNTGAYATPDKTHRLLKRASSSIGALLRLESSDMRSLINIL